jgi:excisionase family DNA binding protein
MEAKMDGLQLFDVYEAARRLGMSHWRLRELKRRGKIAYLQMGQRLMFDARDLEAFVEQYRVAPVGKDEHAA